MHRGWQKDVISISWMNMQLVRGYNYLQKSTKVELIFGTKNVELNESAYALMLPVDFPRNWILKWRLIYLHKLGKEKCLENGGAWIQFTAICLFVTASTISVCASPAALSVTSAWSSAFQYILIKSWFSCQTLLCLGRWFEQRKQSQ